MRRRDFLALGLAGLAARRRRPRPRVGAGGDADQAAQRLHPAGARESHRAGGGLSLIVRVGTRWETRDDAGISNLLQFMVVRGTEKLDGAQIVAAADRMGGSIDAWGDVEPPRSAPPRCRATPPRSSTSSPTWRSRPPCPPATTEAVRDFILNQLRNRGDKPYDVAVDTLLAHCTATIRMPGAPWGGATAWSASTRDAMIAHTGATTCPSEMFLAVSGRVRAREVLAQVEKRFGGIPAGPPPPLRPRPFPRPPPRARRWRCRAPRPRSSPAAWRPA